MAGGERTATCSGLERAMLVVNRRNLPTQHQGSILYSKYLISTKCVLKQVLVFLFMIIARDNKIKNGSINPKLIKIKYTEAKAKRLHSVHNNH